MKAERRKVYQINSLIHILSKKQQKHKITIIIIKVLKRIENPIKSVY